MAYGTIKVDTITFTDAGVDKSVTISGLVQNPTFSGNITVTGTVSGNTIQGQTVSGATITGGAAVFTTVTGGVATITSGVFALGSASNPSISFTGDANSGLYSPGADQVAISTGGTGRLFVDASGRIGVGRTPVAYGSYNVLDLAGSAGSIQKWVHTGSTVELQAYASATLTAIGSATNHPFIITTNDTERLRITAAGLVGIGTTTPQGKLVISNSGAEGLEIYPAYSSGLNMQFHYNRSGAVFVDSQSRAATHQFYINNTESVRIDTSGRLLVGTSSARTDIGSNQTAAIQTESTANGLGYFTAYNQANAFGSVIALAKSRGTSVGSNTIVQSGDQIGGVYFYGADGVDTALAAGIDCYVDGTPGSNDMPGRLVFSTTADGASSPTERMRLTSAGRLGLGTTSPSTTLDCKGDITLGSQNASAANVQPTTGSGTNIAGTHLTLRAGIPTGSGASGQVQIFPSTSSATSGTSPATNASKGLYLRQQITSWDSNPGLFMLNAVFGLSASEGNRSGLVNDGTVVTIDGANNGSQSALEIVGSSNATNATQGFIRFFGSGSKNPYVTIGASTPGVSYTSGNFFINTYNSGTEGTVATFTNTGRLGIGTTSPSYKLNVSGTTGIIKGDSAGCTFGNPSVNLVDSTHGVELLLTPISGLGAIGTYTNHPLAFYTNNGERARIDSSGRVGIGITSPADVLHVNNGNIRVTNTNPAIGLYGANGSSPQVIFGNAAGTNHYLIYETTDGSGNRGSLTFYDAVAATTRAVIDSSGRVGIGTTAPLARLDITGSAAPLILQSTTSAANYITHKHPSSGDIGYIGGGGGAALTAGTASDYVIRANLGSLIFACNGDNERARIDTSGRLLVSTSTARTNLYGTGVGNPTIQVEAAGMTGHYRSIISICNNSTLGTGPTLALMASGDNSVGAVTIVNTGHELGIVDFLGTDGAKPISAASIRAVVDGTPGTNDMPGRLVFSTTADGASSPTERMRINNAGYLKATTTGGYFGVSSTFHEMRTATNNSAIVVFSHDGTSGQQYGINIGTTNDQNDTVRYFIQCIGGATERATIRSNGGLANYSANNVNLSDRNVKKDIAPAPGTWSCLKEWEIVNFRYKDQSDDVDLSMGVIAQQIAESCPEVITVFQEAKEAKEAVLDEEGNELEPAQELQHEKLGVKDQQMMWMAIKALQEAQLRIETLEAEVAALKVQQSYLLNRLVTFSKPISQRHYQPQLDNLLDWSY